MVDQPSYMSLVHIKKVPFAHRENLGFQLFSPKTLRRKIFVREKVRPRSITTSPMQLSIRQTHPTNTFVERGRHIQDKQWALRYVESFQKNSKNSAVFFDKKRPKKLWQKIPQHAAQLNAVPSISAKTLTFSSLL